MLTKYYFYPYFFPLQSKSICQQSYMTLWSIWLCICCQVHFYCYGNLFQWTAQQVFRYFTASPGGPILSSPLAADPQFSILKASNGGTSPPHTGSDFHFGPVSSNFLLWNSPVIHMPCFLPCEILFHSSHLVNSGNLSSWVE